MSFTKLRAVNYIYLTFDLLHKHCIDSIGEILWMLSGNPRFNNSLEFWRKIFRDQNFMKLLGLKIKFVIFIEIKNLFNS
jgi:hypothetical protein